MNVNNRCNDIKHKICPTVPETELSLMFTLMFFSQTEESIDVVLPLAHDYQVKATLQKCEDWLLTEIEFIVGEVTGHTKETQEKVEFFAKCLLYGTKHDLETLYKRALELLVPYKLSRYQHTEFYKLLPDKQKSQLLETRMVKIEETNKIGDGNFLQTITPPNIPSQATMFGVSASVSENVYTCNSTHAFGSRGSRR